MTIEEQLDLVAAISQVTTDVLIVDCLTTWIGNVMHHQHPDEFAFVQSELAIDAIRRNGLTAIVISNEVGLGIVPATEMTRHYRDLLGRVNQTWAKAADHALLMVAGRALPLHDPHGLLQ